MTRKNGQKWFALFNNYVETGFFFSFNFESIIHQYNIKRLYTIID